MVKEWDLEAGKNQSNFQISNFDFMFYVIIGIFSVIHDASLHKTG